MELTLNVFSFLSLVQVEYEVVGSCKGTGDTGHGCVDTKGSRARIPTGGYVVYGVAHQHTGGAGSTLYGEVIFLVLQSSIRILDKHSKRVV